MVIPPLVYSSNKGAQSIAFSSEYKVEVLKLFSSISCVDNYRVPCSSKIDNALPVFKKNDPSELSNYRLISLLSCVDKIMERIVYKHMYNVFFFMTTIFFTNIR